VFWAAYVPVVKLDTEHPAIFNQTVTQSQYARLESAVPCDGRNPGRGKEGGIKNTRNVLQGYGLLECYRSEDAETVLVRPAPLLPPRGRRSRR